MAEGLIKRKTDEPRKPRKGEQWRTGVNDDVVILDVGPFGETNDIIVQFKGDDLPSEVLTMGAFISRYDFLSNPAPMVRIVDDRPGFQWVMYDNEARVICMGPRFPNRKETAQHFDEFYSLMSTLMEFEPGARRLDFGPEWSPDFGDRFL